MKQKDVPRDLLIKENLWTIKFVRKVPCGGKDILGLCDPSCLTIFLKTKQSFEELSDSVFHEIIHAFEFEYRFDLKHDHVYKLASAFARLLCDNF